MASFDAFLKIDGIEGESADSKHKNQIEIESFSFGATQSGTFAHGSGGGAGKVQMQDFHITMKVSKASATLALACASGQHIKKAILYVRKAGGQQEDYYQVTFSDLLVSSYAIGGASRGDILPVDQVSLNFAKIEWKYQLQNEKGNVGNPVITGWDLKQNKKL